MSEVKGKIKKVLVRLIDSSGSFTDPTQPNGSISGTNVSEVELTGFIAMAIQGRALYQLSELEEKAYREEQIANEPPEPEPEPEPEPDKSKPKQAKK